MSKYTEDQIKAAATAIADMRASRRGGPKIENILSVLAKYMPNLFVEVMEDAEAALNTLDRKEKP